MLRIVLVTGLLAMFIITVPAQTGSPGTRWENAQCAEDLGWSSDMPRLAQESSEPSAAANGK